MSLEAIEKVTEVESKMQERRAAAEAEAKQIVADAESGGLALLQQVRADAAESGKKLLKQAEDKAAKRTAEITKAAEVDGAALRKAAGSRLDDAAEFIVGRVVKH
jgi:vacuolar-type H+-ATPase subunit H